MSDRLYRFIDCFVPVHLCNFRCRYCYILQNKLFDNVVNPPDHSPEEFGRAFSKKRVGGTCLFNFCGGGETLMMPRILEYLEQILMQGHYIMIVTNGTCFNIFEKMSKWPLDYRERTFFKFSYHYQQLKENKLLDKYFENILKMRRLGFSFTVELVPHDELILEIDLIKNTCYRFLGAYPHVTVARDETKKELPILTSLDKDKYYEIWNTFDSELFRFKYSIFGVRRKEFCNAGYRSCYVNMKNGDIAQCYSSRTPSTNIYNRKFKMPGPICSCCEKHCYNGHAFLTFGDINSLDTPSFFDLRNRVSKDGYNWVNDKMACIFKQRAEAHSAFLNLKSWVKCKIKG